ncbi:MAG: hypothetical protein ABSH20_27790, partial [Tepidisphaeraceae bacterium]
PCVPKGISSVELRNIAYRRMIIDVTVRGSGTKVNELVVNGRTSADGFLAAQDEGRKTVTIITGDK